MMEVEEGDVFQRTRWALRHYAWVVALVVAAAVTAGWYITSAESETGRYRATALVVANTLDVPATHLPRFAAAVFDSGAVAEGVARELGVALDPQELVPLHISMDPVSDSIAFLVHGMSDDPRRSVDLANTAADQFVRELNRAGPGVGTFSVQDPARVPRQQLSWLRREVALAVSGVGGMLIAVALVGFIVWLRRPLITPGDVVAAFGLPLLGVVSVGRDGPLPGSVRTVTSHPLVMHSLAQRLGGTPHDGFVLVGEPRSMRSRRALWFPLREHLRRGNEASTTAAAGDSPPRAARARQPGPQPPSRRPAHLLPSSPNWARTNPGARSFGSRPGVRVVLIEDWDAHCTDASSWGVIVVVEQGTPTRNLSEVLAEWSPGDAIGVIMLRQQTRRTRLHVQGQRDG